LDGKVFRLFRYDATAPLEGKTQPFSLCLHEWMVETVISGKYQEQDEHYGAELNLFNL